MTDIFSPIDLLVLVAYLIVVLSLGFYYSRRSEENYTDYFLAGRNIGWFTVGISIFATNISSEHFIGLAGSGSIRGLAVGQFELMAIFTLIFLGWVLAPVYLKSGVFTMPEFLELRFDVRIRKFFAAFSIVIYIFTKILVSLFAAGLLFYKIFGLNIYASSILIVLITGLYSVTGGANAVFRTQLFQGLILILGAVSLSLFGLNAVGGFTGLEQKLPADFFNMFKNLSDPDFPWTGILFGAPIIAFWYWCTDQYIVQRILSARSVNDARRGTLVAAFLKVLPIFVLVLPGLIAVALYPEISGDEAYAALVAGDLLPVGIKGLVVAGLLAAIMSSLAGAFNSTAILFTNDFYKIRYPGANERKLVLVGRLATTAVVVAAILIVPLVKLISSQIYLFLQNVQAFVAPPITAVFLFGLFSKKTSADTAITTLIVGEAIGLFRLFLQMLMNYGVELHPVFQWLLGINFLHFAIFLFVLSISLIVVLNYASSKKNITTVFGLKYTITESMMDITSGVSNLRSVRGIKSNLILSAFIVIIIIGLWSLWY
ncbi:MAG: sodium:solute symporter [Ignavibacteriales bacterium]|nr:MAG: sodium:solute symporter [Ignavibacteriales bacterium]